MTVVSICVHERYLFSSGVCQQSEMSLYHFYIHILYFVKFSFTVSLSYQKEPLYKIWFLCCLKFENLSEKKTE